MRAFHVDLETLALAGISGKEEAVVLGGSIGRYVADAIGVDWIHRDRLAQPVGASIAVLNDAERIDPNVADVNLERGVEAVPKGPGQR